MTKLKRERDEIEMNPSPEASQTPCRTNLSLHQSGSKKNKEGNKKMKARMIRERRMKNETEEEDARKEGGGMKKPRTG